MNDQKSDPKKPAPKAPVPDKKAERDSRSARALRENLKRRKAQLKERQSGSDGAQE